MHEVELSPNAAALSQSMRDIGYSLETAIADLIDNSISAQAETISIVTENPDSVSVCLAVIDDGTGMSGDVALEAMRPGSRNPRLERQPDDLGRFGLGLKTASFSQCKSLTVITRKDGITFAAQWDLDLISERNCWVVRILDEEETVSLPLADQLGTHGTCVLWQKLDRFSENTLYTASNSDFYEKLDQVRKHLALVYHRYLSGEYGRRRIRILISGDPVEPFDPFCISNKATQLLPEEIVPVNGQKVRIQPFILPHHSKLSRDEYEFYRSRSDFVSNQGAYVYRNGRLMAWGDWFRIVPKTEATKLARVRIDFPTSLDELWTIDIKKSRAHPPPQVRQALSQIINRIIEQSRRVHVGRGERLYRRDEQMLWNRYADRDGIRYKVNRDHPLVSAFSERIDPSLHEAFLGVIEGISNSLPLEALYADYSNSPQVFEEQPQVSEEALRASLMSVANLFRVSGILDKARFARAILSVPPFRQNKQMTQQIIEELE